MAGVLPEYKKQLDLVTVGVLAKVLVDLAISSVVPRVT
jgi:hypothetical protein